MAWQAVIAGGILASAALGAQPSAVRPVAAPMRDLQWGQINFLHTTDTHGWHGGHLQESQYSADWGDYISFASHMRNRAESEGRDLLLVDTGDRVEGNGLYDASSPKGKYYFDIYREQDIDLICVGNHELYIASTSDDEYQKTVPNFRDSYIASNLNYIDPKTGKGVPMAQRYKRFRTKIQKLNIVAFGFIFDFAGNGNNTIVQPVRETVKERWFQEAIREPTDLFVVIGHVGLQMPEFKIVYEAIRKQNWFTPIAFFGGHAHVRDATRYDAKSFAMASGRYFETIGWMSIDGIGKTTAAQSTAAVTFRRRYIDNNLLGLYHHSGMNETTFPTEHGRKVTKMITKARDTLDLDYTFGCAPRDLWMTRAPFPAQDSIYTWLETEVLPDVVVNEQRQNQSRLALLNTGGIRFDIFKGAFTRDTTYIVSPFLSKFSYIPDVPYGVATKVVKLLNSGGEILDAPGILPSKSLTIPEQLAIHKSGMHEQSRPHLEALDFDQSVQRPLGGTVQKPTLIGGYTTKDDIGSDGDDAVHSPLNFYEVPNCIQAEIAFPANNSEPETVDVVFLDFIQPWVLLALKFAGGDYGAIDVGVYSNETFTDLMAGWIKENWKKNC